MNNNEEIRIALLGIMVKDRTETGKLNELLSEYGEYIIGRMGLPHCKDGVNLISVAMEAPMPVINGLSGKIGRLNGITSKVLTN
ncbi:MAG: iron-only hydrogenase system regulator [Lachnospiraceae bacterium]|nr:iron-only hydrogenase system regulator [Lachnospiraceae bacterium]MCR5635143.1 iron-only hydrogenase system regulator [Lachnospiraceae bacterium]